MARPSSDRQRWHAHHAWLPGGLATDVTLDVQNGRFTAITAGRRPAVQTKANGDPMVRPETGGDQMGRPETGDDPRGRSPTDPIELPGLVLPGFANAHSHAFHRALRGRTHEPQGSFWTWRQRMYHLAERLDPDSYLTLATATYAEMALAGVTSVGEFHYLHHGAKGRPYDDPNAMGKALVEAATQAGIRLTLLDTCYLAGGLSGEGHLPLDPVQRRFADRDVAGWSERVGLLTPTPSLRVGVAAHSVRAVPADALGRMAEASVGRVFHMHLSEQPAENAASLAFYGVTPTTLVARCGLLGPATTVVHATHLCDADVALLGDSATNACFCPTTERDLADGIGPARRLVDAGSPLCLGSDQHAVIDLLEEARALEMDERLASGQRGRFDPAELVRALAGAGQRSIDWPDAGELRVGARADLVALRLDTARTAGASPEQALLAATGADIDTVIAEGHPVVRGGRHVLGDVGALLQAAIEPLWATV